ncbi:probable cytokinin riboside 5'-monophosphate phosphoribohydrolase LOGL10 isoform X1 [Rhododendron vialii]|uniref:probable cytokinin riboside 5'-monophosphate phosphoribohydrolase LOGL10 isoform X1 n=1 Tax=Rhododendron vialii TaxID=182163 RepID=UPI00265F1316|nr:probable cytokinin riboside 5'-monophosphate phosphoribohydrolase LOGL10 isoform X1 [Rhododendron vialii]
MGFPVAATFGPRIFFRNCCEKSVNFPSFDHKEGHKGNFKLSKFKPRPSRISACKPEVFRFEERTSPNAVKKEIERCYELIHRLGRGVVYLGSSRMGPSHPHYLQTLELGKEATNLLNCTSWSGAGPGLMDAATKGALQAGKPVGGFKIGKEANEWTATNFHPYLPSETYLTCRFFTARKHGLVDAAVRLDSSDKTAVIALPGGVGTLDEVFEILALIQLERIGSAFPVPFLLMNYDSFYSKLLEFLDVCEEWGTVAKGEVSLLWKVCDDNSQALAYLEEFYDLSSEKSTHGDRSQSSH